MAVVVPFESHTSASIDRLVELVTADMERVNAAILSRTGSDVTMIPEVANHLRICELRSDFLRSHL